MALTGLSNEVWSAPLTRTELPFPLHARGKVRDVYDLGDTYLMIATDRISAFDHVLEPGIPGKGIILTQMSNFWFQFFADIPNHLVETDFERFPARVRDFPELKGRSVLTRKCRVIPIECVARGYLIGSGWSDYQRDGTVCGLQLPPGLDQAARLPNPIFTPATKAESGHDENISFSEVVSITGEERASLMRELTLLIYREAASHAAERGVIIADTKIELGTDSGEDSGNLIWIDEALTPDSSRFWPAEGWETGQSPPSFDKQYVRDFLETAGWDKESAPPVLPAEVIRGTIERYLEAYERLTDDHDLRGGVISKT